MSWEQIIANAGMKVVLDSMVNRGLLDKTFAYFKKKQPILTIGCSGVGKSQFLTNLQGISDVISPYVRTRHTEAIDFKLQDMLLKITDTPGEDTSTGIIYNDKIRNTFSNKGSGIINVVSYGYHEIGGKPDFSSIRIEELIKNNQKKELEHLHSLIPFIEYSKIKWMITIVNKADLWWNDRTLVESYYKNGLYFQELQHIKKTFSHEVLPYCSVMKTFYETPLSGHFDQCQKEHLEKLFLQSLSKFL